MAEKPFDEYLRQINEAYLRGDATEDICQNGLDRAVEVLEMRGEWHLHLGAAGIK